MSARTLQPAVAGSWYPKDPTELAALVDGLLARAAEKAAAPEGAVKALIAPHAGLSYSGAVAASAFSTIAGRLFDRVVLLGPSHYFAFAGAAIPEPSTASYRTPLGDLPIDHDALSQAKTGTLPVFRESDRVFEPEHALEAELPFLQRALRIDVPVVPVLMGGASTSEDARAVAHALSPLLDEKTLLVISTDFTHFGPRFDYVPFTEDVERRIRELDLGAIRAIEAHDAAAFSTLIRTTGATICGHRAVEVFLRRPAAGASAKLLDYDTSGRMTGDWDHSVSYAAIAVTR